MARYIDIDKYDNFNNECGQIYCNGQFCIDCYYNNGGAEDVAPVVHAEWEHHGVCILACSNCHDTIMCDRVSNYCPNCGAIMDRK